MHHQPTTIILDWDDTILPSTWIASAGHGLCRPFQPDPLTSQELKELENSIIQFFNLILNYTDLFCLIITNAEHGWIQRSCEKFIPMVLPYLTSNRIKIISARSLYEPYYPYEPSVWKCVAFVTEIENLYRNLQVPDEEQPAAEQQPFEPLRETIEREACGCETNQVNNNLHHILEIKGILKLTNPIAKDIITPILMDLQLQGEKVHKCQRMKNIISFGDSIHEQKALKIVRNTFQNSITKFIKFVERPTINEIRLQLQHMVNYFQYFYACEHHLDLMLSFPMLDVATPFEQNSLA